MWENKKHSIRRGEGHLNHGWEVPGKRAAGKKIIRAFIPPADPITNINIKYQINSINRMTGKSQANVPLEIFILLFIEITNNEHFHIHKKAWSNQTSLKTWWSSLHHHDCYQHLVSSIFRDSFFSAPISNSPRYISSTCRSKKNNINIKNISYFC